jgi:hypothetical protein
VTTAGDALAADDRANGEKQQAAARCRGTAALVSGPVISEMKLRRVKHSKTVSGILTCNERTPSRPAPRRGCSDGALVGEIARSGPQTRALCTEGLKDTLVLLIDRHRAAGNDADNATPRRTAISIYSAMLSAIGATRAVDDPALSEEIMRSTAAQSKALALPPDGPCSEGTPRQVR